MHAKRSHKTPNQHSSRRILEKLEMNQLLKKYTVFLGCLVPNIIKMISSVTFPMI